MRGNPTAAYEQHEYLRMKLEQLWPPAIPFISKEKKKKKKDGLKVQVRRKIRMRVNSGLLTLSLTLMITRMSPSSGSR